MTNPYIDNDDKPPGPEGSRAQWFVVLAVAIAGCFLPSDGCEYTPGPKPEPSPIVDPETTLGAWVVVVEETEDRTPETAGVLTDRSFWDGLAERGLKFRIIDEDSQDASAYMAIASAVGLPCLIVLRADGQVLLKQRLPSTVAQLDTEVKKVTSR